MRSTVDPESNPMVAKLSRFLPLSEDDIDVLMELTSARRRILAHVDVVKEGDVPHSAFALLEGMACRYRIMADGRRQILSFIVPGDICDIHATLVDKVDHSICTIAPTTIAAIVRERLLEVIAHFPRIGAALSWNALQEEAIQREHVVALGRRNAHGRVAYLFCELVWRQRANGLAEDDAIPAADDAERDRRYARIDAGACESRAAGFPEARPHQLGSSPAHPARW